MKKLLLTSIIALSLKAELPEPKLVEETKEYKIYCIEETLWLKWNSYNTPPVQIFMPGYSSLPAKCK